MHGRSVESIEHETKLAMSALVDQLGVVTWHAISLAMPPLPQGTPIFVGERGGNFANSRMVAAAILGFEHRAGGDHPSEDAIPSVQLSVATRFGDKGEEDTRP